MYTLKRFQRIQDIKILIVDIYSKDKVLLVDLIVFMRVFNLQKWKARLLKAWRDYVPLKCLTEFCLPKNYA